MSSCMVVDEHGPCTVVDSWVDVYGREVSFGSLPVRQSACVSGEVNSSVCMQGQEGCRHCKGSR